jgi:hypothetical protein
MMRWQRCCLCEGERIGEFENIKGGRCTCGRVKQELGLSQLGDP